MATFGQGVNPSLGAINYAPYSQGAAQGSAAIGKGLANLGQDLAQGIQQYRQNKLMAGQATAEFEAAAQGSPKMLSTISAENAPPEVAKAFKKLQKDGQVGLKDAAVLSTYAKTFITGEQRQKAAEMNMEKLRVDQFNAVSERMRSEAAAREKASPLGKVMTIEEIMDLKTKGFDADAAPVGDGRFMVTKISPFAPGAKTEINMGGDSYEKEVGKLAGEQHMKEYAAAVDAPANLAKLDEVSNILKTGDPSTGIGAEIFNNINRLRSQFTADKQAGKSVTDTQVLDALLGSDVFPQIAALGIGARGLDTPAEREFLRQVMTGTINLDKSALVRMTDIRRNIQTRALEKFKKSYDSGTYKKFFEITGNPLPDFGVLEKAPSDPIMDAARAELQRRKGGK